MFDQQDIKEQGIDDSGTDIDLLAQYMTRLKLGAEMNHDAEVGDVGVNERVRSNLLTSENPVFAQDRPSSKVSFHLKV